MHGPVLIETVLRWTTMKLFWLMRQRDTMMSSTSTAQIVDVDSDDDVEESEQWDFDDFQRCHLPSYAEGMATALERHGDSEMHSCRNTRRSCVFVDDECQEDTP
ncbi:hypothetical protein O6H91_19G051100 [Diphasiastrum complanatum]|uniref:Uncharacterized protein n=1 Tax=Diphasiastrum complanatum TaxID=34168 RepID=A0ACC2AV27_DIPCM|nr:hypothetical protein O6H91_19G051100 [Diphasiastrum complanatum]